MTRWASFLILPLLAGCSSPGGGDGWGRYVGPQEYQWPLRAELERQHERIGLPAETAKEFDIEVQLCPLAGENGDGTYACGDCIGGICAHGATWMVPFSRKFLMKYPVGPVQHHIVAHECGHVITIAHAGEGGHKSHYTIYGKRYPISDIIGGVRWPSIVDRIAFWNGWADGRSFGCRIDTITNGADTLEIPPGNH